MERKTIREEARRDAARLLRRTFRLEVPVEPAGLARDLGVRVLESALDENTLGGLVMESGEEPKILLNQRHGFLRRRLTCALELGHYVRRSAETNIYARVDLLGDPSSHGEQQEEAYAEEFAASLLMPEEEVQFLTEIGLDDLEMALRFVVPREAMRLRLRDLGLRIADLWIA